MNYSAYIHRSTHNALIPSTSRRRRFDLKTVAQAVVAAMTTVIDRLRQAGVRAARRADARATYHRLRELDSRTLRDLGIDRSELYSLAVETHGERDATRRLRGRAPDFPSNLTRNHGAPHEFRF